MERRLAAVLISDVVGYTKLMEEDTEGTVVAWSDARDKVIDPTVSSSDGRVVKFTGDGFLAEFGTVQAALECAIDIQNKLSDNPLEFRMAINLGDIIDDGRDIHGEGINIAARLEGISEPGGICISGDVYNQVRNRVDAEFEDLGSQEVKNVAEPVQAYAVRFKNTTGHSDKGAASPQTEKPSIAVLPFDNMSGDPEQEYFSDGITEDIITALSHLKWLNVIARNSSFTYKGQSPDIRTVSEELNVRYVLEGSIRRAGNRVRINAQLLEGETGNHIWAEKYDRELEDIFEVQDEINGSVMSAIQPSLMMAEIERSLKKHPDNLDAYDFFLRALPELYAFEPERNQNALGLLHQALELSPDYPEALAHTAWGYEQRSTRGWPNYAQSDRDAGVALAQKAIATNSQDPLVLALSAFVMIMAGKNYELGLLTAQRALQINPNIAQVSLFAGNSIMFSGGDLDKALDCFNEALKTSPLDPTAYLYYTSISWIKLALGEIDEAVEASKKSVQMNPGWVSALWLLSAALAEQGDVKSAKDLVDQILVLDETTSITKISNSLKINSPLLMESLMNGLRKAGLPEE